MSLLFIYKLFQSRLQIGQLKSYGVSNGLVHVKAIVVFIAHAQQPRLPDENFYKKPNNAKKRPEKGQTDCSKARKNQNFKKVV